ncbi:ectopic P granules protein 3-like [Diaphorina citri]|uniref:Ectopic P granules protein 3-like n=1 Tax=Diaphorina citri TaxID=121845 RepID=A0A1S3D517_DIACI|nr:ectopic P granules protein 3-like [Diaphorina citri]
MDSNAQGNALTSFGVKFEQCTKEQLKSELKKHGLKCSGNKRELIRRLSDFTARSSFSSATMPQPTQPINLVMCESLSVPCAPVDIEEPALSKRRTDSYSTQPINLIMCESLSVPCAPVDIEEPALSKRRTDSYSEINGGGNADFGSGGWWFKSRILCPESPGVAADWVPSLWSIMNKVKLEAMMWGAGTALGELPPYFLSRAARLSLLDPDDVDDLVELEELHKKKNNPETMTLVDKLKLKIETLVNKVGFFGILACASIPNPLFDLAGITCGHFLIPFWTFFGATLIGKAVIKMSIQGNKWVPGTRGGAVVRLLEKRSLWCLYWVGLGGAVVREEITVVSLLGSKIYAPMFKASLVYACACAQIIVHFSFIRILMLMFKLLICTIHNHRVVPLFGALLVEPVTNLWQRQKQKLHNRTDDMANSGNILASLIEYIMILLVLFFVISIVNTMAQAYHKRIHSAKSKK